MGRERSEGAQCARRLGRRNEHLVFAAPSGAHAERSAALGRHRERETRERSSGGWMPMMGSMTCNMTCLVVQSCLMRHPGNTRIMGTRGSWACVSYNLVRNGGGGGAGAYILSTAQRRPS